MANIRALLIMPGGNTAVTVRIGRELAAFQGVVAGLIQAVPCTHEATMYINEEGKFLAHCVPNQAATDIQARGYGLRGEDYITGPALIVGNPDPDDEEGETTSVPDSVLALCAHAKVSIVGWDEV